MNPAIETRAIRKRYRQRTAVDGVSLAVRPGEVVGLLGPNGAGKTTLLRMLSGHLSPTSGEIRVMGHRLPSQVAEVKNTLGFLTAGMSLYDRLTVRENLRYFGKLREIPSTDTEARIARLEGDFDLHSFLDQRFSQLSSGQRQRALIAATVLHDPQVLILDEITAALDVIASSFIVEFVRRERDRGKAILFSTHIISEAEYVCDRLYLIHQGQLRGEGTPSQLLDRTGARNLTEAFLAILANSPTPESDACSAAKPF